MISNDPMCSGLMHVHACFRVSNEACVDQVGVM